MSISETRVKQVFEEISKQSLLEGYVPTPDEVVNRFTQWSQQNDPSRPRMKLRPQGYRKRFNRENFNTMVEEMVGDLQLLFGESVGNITRVLKGLNSDDIRYRALSYQLRILDDLLEDILLAEPSASNYFFGVFDSFNDLSKTDMAETTADVDLNAGIVRLPIKGGVNRLDLARVMTGRHRSGMKVKPEQNDLRVQLIAGSRFDYAFNDVDGQAWQEEVTTTFEGPLSAEITFPINLRDPFVEPDLAETTALPISKIEIDPVLSSAASLDVLYSVDGVNYIKVPNHPTVIQLMDQRVSITFQSTIARFLRLRLTKSPDGEAQIGTGTPFYRYVFGLRRIAVFNSGFGTSAIFQSISQSPENTSEPVSKVALNVQERVPAEGQIDYFVALGPQPLEWFPISPGSRETADSPKVVEFGTSLLSPRRDNFVKVTTTPPVYGTRNGITFYELYTTGHEPIPMSSRLFRGLNSWGKKVKFEESIKSVRNNYVVFTLTDREQKLYLEINDEEVTPPDSVGGQTTEVSVEHVVFRDESVPVKPESGTPPENPNYSVRRILRLIKSGQIGGVGADVSVVGATTPRTITVTLPAAASGNVTVGQFLRLVQAAGGSGYFEIVTVEDTGSGVTVTILDPNDVLVTEINCTWTLGYADITHQIRDVIQNRIVIEASQELFQDDRLLISYRRPLGPEHRLITSSVVVKRDPTDDSPFQLGRDYTVDSVAKSVARLPDGAIQGAGSQIVVRVDFQYAYKERQLDTYVCFFTIDSPNPKKIIFAAPIGADEDEGERVHIDDGTNFHNISNELESPDLPKGMRQVVVVSKPIIDPETGSVDTTSAIYKTLTAKDAGGFIVFSPNNRYFVSAAAFPVAMKETDIFKLQTNITADDHSRYAFDGQKVVINWDPTELPDTIYPVVDNSGPSPVLSLLDYEEFEMQYRYKVPGVVTSSEVIFKAILSRRQKSDKGITPELLNYNLRFSF